MIDEIFETESIVESNYLFSKIVPRATFWVNVSFKYFVHVLLPDKPQAPPYCWTAEQKWSENWRVAVYKRLAKLYADAHK